MFEAVVVVNHFQQEVKEGKVPRLRRLRVRNVEKRLYLEAMRTRPCTSVHEISNGQDQFQKAVERFALLHLATCRDDSFNARPDVVDPLGQFATEENGLQPLLVPRDLVHFPHEAVCSGKEIHLVGQVLEHRNLFRSGDVLDELLDNVVGNGMFVVKREDGVVDLACSHLQVHERDGTVLSPSAVNHRDFAFLGLGSSYIERVSPGLGGRLLPLEGRKLFLYALVFKELVGMLLVQLDPDCPRHLARR
mmetsp:Transcript_16259/g.42176  ORF Transcript_16259/g.42176 Transcript_16259/m.42176 type:complete len:248 (-) Transcript_16259:155-898(-)